MDSLPLSVLSRSLDFRSFHLNLGKYYTKSLIASGINDDRDEEFKVKSYAIAIVFV
jgi:hypothetical protein